jgi:hypothetical protein
VYALAKQIISNNVSVNINKCSNSLLIKLKMIWIWCRKLYFYFEVQNDILVKIG